MCCARSRGSSPPPPAPTTPPDLGLPGNTSCLHQARSRSDSRSGDASRATTPARQQRLLADALADRHHDRHNRHCQMKDQPDPSRPVMVPDRGVCVESTDDKRRRQQQRQGYDLPEGPGLRQDQAPQEEPDDRTEWDPPQQLERPPCLWTYRPGSNVEIQASACHNSSVGAPTARRQSPSFLPRPVDGSYLLQQHRDRSGASHQRSA